MAAIACSKCGRDILREIKYRPYRHKCSCGWAGNLFRATADCPKCSKAMTGELTGGFLCKNCMASSSQTVGQMASAAISGITSKDKLEIESIADIEVTSEYLAVKRLLEMGISPILVIGKAGTGKSTLIRYLKGVFPAKNIVVVAPTGVAALNAKGVTIHSFFKLPPTLIQSQDITTLNGRNLYKNIDILVIDEVSMVRADLLDGINWFLLKNGKSSTAPFGGTQVVMIGDLFQLPPVTNPEEGRALTTIGYQSGFFFSAKSLRDMNIVPVELTHIYRQKDAAFVELLNQVRVAKDRDMTVQYLNEHCFRRPSASNVVTLATTNAIVDSKNKMKLAKLPCVESVFMGKAEGSFAIEEARLPSPMRLILKPGAQVMFTKNDEQKRWVNGTVGRVLTIEEPSVRVELLTDKPGNICEVLPVTWESYKYLLDNQSSSIHAEVTGRYTQYPLILAWAVTIHKAQGKTLESVHIDFGNGTFDSGQAYVALSRSRTLQGITMERPIRVSDISCSRILKEFNERLVSQIPDIEDLAGQTSKGPSVEGNYNVVGLQYNEFNKKGLVPSLHSEVSLVCDPNNTYDPNAVRVEWAGHLLGHISRFKNKELSSLILSGTKFTATVIDSLVSQEGVLNSLTINVRVAFRSEIL